MSTEDSFRKSAFEILSERRERLFSTRANSSPFLGNDAAVPAGLLDLAKSRLTRNSRVLIMGNGRSDLAAGLAKLGHRITLVDCAPRALAATEDMRRTLSRTEADLVTAKLITPGKFPFADASFDAVILMGALSQVGHHTPLLKKCARLLADGGELLVAVPDNLAHYHSEFVTLWTEESLAQTLGLYFEEYAIASRDGVLLAHASNSQAVKHPVIFAMMNIRNEDRWLRDVLDNAARICDGIVVYDDGSTDKTPDICRTHPAVVAYRREEEQGTDKSRDKNRMWEMALEHKFDWMLAIDGDELLEPTAPRRMLAEIKNCPQNVTQIDFEFLYLWNDHKHYRTDGIYTGIYHPCLFRPTAQTWNELSFAPTAHAGNLHCERVPQNLTGDRHRADIKIEHLGYKFAEDRLRKYHWNKQKDVKHANEGYYEHLLDQPHMTLAPWDGRPDSITRGKDSVEKQTLKPDYYYANARRNLAERVPKNAKEVLDVGCGNGATGKLIHQLTGARVTGIEIHPEVAQVARQVLADVHVLDVEADALPFASKQFDCILCGDVLEHLIDPWAALKKLKAHLKPTGCIIASLPNVRNLGVIAKLLEGSWNYQEFGILDSTHLRFFARQDMEKLFASAGLRAELVEVVRDPLFEQQMRTPPQDTLTLDMGGLVLRDVTPQDLNELTAQQLIYMATPDASVLPKPKPVASVVIPVYDNLKYTEACLKSLFETPEETPHEIIVVDDGSTDGTAQFLVSLGDKIRVVTHEQNHGFARSCNDGARASIGQVVVFLNNDTEVLPGWLDEMMNSISSDRSIGIVGNLQIFPGTNRVQQCGVVCDDTKHVHSLYNNQLPADHPVVQKPREFQFIAGSCLMIWRQLFMEVGGFDESYLNSCEDIDLCLRVTQTRRKVWYCPKSKIYHHESKSVTGHDKGGANYTRLLSRWKDLMIADADRYYLEDGFMRLADGRIVPLDKPEETQQMASDTRIALLTTYHQRCGLATYAEKLCDALADNGETVLILAEKTSDITAVDMPNVVRCWTRDQDGGREILPLLLSRKIEVLHINHGGMFALDGWLLEVVKEARAHGIRVVTLFHTTETQDKKIAELARHSDACRVHHPQNVVELVALGAPSDRIRTMTHPVPEPQFTDVAEAKLLLEWNPEQKVIATFGMADPHKGILELIEMMPSLSESIDVKLLIIGAPHPASEAGRNYLIQCMNRVHELAMEDRIRFLTDFVPEPELMATLQACDVIVLNHQSARYESSGSLAHALASGRPVVTSKSPAFDTTLPVTMRITEQFDLVQTITRALKNPFLTRLLKESVIEYARENSWDNAAKRYLACYEQVLSAEPACTTDLLKYYATHPDDIYNEKLQRERVRWLAEKTANSGTILEVGPANGYVISYCKGHEAVDLYRERLDVARALRPGIKFKYANATKGLPQADKSFDVVMSPEIFEHVEWEQAVFALKECMRVGKRVVVTIPNADKPNYNPDLVHNIEHRWLVTRQLLDAWLKEAGAVDYELDCSSDLDFYLIDINTTATKPNIRILPRAARLPHSEVSPGPAVTLAMDASLLAEDHLIGTTPGRYFIELINHLRDVRPDWKLKLVTHRADALRERLTRAGAGNSFEVIGWRDVKRGTADALLLPHPTSEETTDLIELARENGMLVAALMNDLIPLAFPQFYLTQDPLIRDRYVATMRALSEKCDLFFCTTQATVQELQIRLGMQLARLRTIHGAPTLETKSLDGAFENPELRALDESKTAYFLHAGELSPVKNLRTMIQAVSDLRQAVGGNLKLVLACNVSSNAAQQLKQAMANDGIDPEILVLPQNVSESDLAKLYSRCVGVLNPSLMEGLSLDLLNALANGAAVVAGKTTAQEETCGEAALYVDALNVAELTEAARLLWTEPTLRSGLSATAKQEARRYDWTRTAEKFAVYLTEQLTRQGTLRALPMKATV
ncbi:MAG: methyltransferase domain-containing protein [Calditrichaeota bacterium]|nr:methyltransferase domain-containing protein [Calditrichota bacterium]